MVVITAFLTPIRRPMISTTGVMQLVVQEAQEIMRSSAEGMVTPWTMQQTCSPLGGADSIAYLAPAARCLLRPSAWVNSPVHSRTISTPRSFQGSWAGSLTLRNFMDLPFTTRPSPLAVTRFLYTP